MICPFCGKETPNTSRFCTKCGKAVDSVPVKPKNQTSQQSSQNANQNQQNQQMQSAQQNQQMQYRQQVQQVQYRQPGQQMQYSQPVHPTADSDNSSIWTKWYTYVIIILMLISIGLTVFLVKELTSDGSKEKGEEVVLDDPDDEELEGDEPAPGEDETADEGEGDAATDDVAESSDAESEESGDTAEEEMDEETRQILSFNVDAEIANINSIVSDIDRKANGNKYHKYVVDTGTTAYFEGGAGTDTIRLVDIPSGANWNTYALKYYFSGVDLVYAEYTMGTESHYYYFANVGTLGRKMIRWVEYDGSNSGAYIVHELKDADDTYIDTMRAISSAAHDYHVMLKGASYGAVGTRQKISK